MWRLLARVVVAVLVLAAGLGIAGSSGVAAQTVAEVEVRDRLIADQEALLNVYRCMFNVDTQVVPGGCTNGAPGSPAQDPAPFSGTPTAQDVAVRDQLIINQEALLNVYRCQFNIDTELVPGGCQESSTSEAPSNLGPVAPKEEPWSEFVRIQDLAIACGWYEGTYKQCRRHPEDTNEIARLRGELFGCEWSISRGGCRGYGIERMALLDSKLFCEEGWIFRFTNARPLEGACYHPDHPRFH